MNVKRLDLKILLHRTGKMTPSYGIKVAFNFVRMEDILLI